MPKIQYVTKRLGAEKLKVIEQANELIAEYMEQGYSLSLRQLYYLFVSRDLIPNTQKDYKRLGNIISDGRRAGLIDWDAIEDRTRNLRKLSTWDDPADIVSVCAEQFRIDLWADQPYRVEAFIEKDALVGVLEVACEEHRVPYFSCRGYTSDSELWSAAQRMIRVRRAGQVPVVLHLGDHDPSGIDMTRDIADRLELFSGRPVEVRRLALNMPQIEQHRPPPNPAKVTDARFGEYQRRYGDESWELDALDPATITELIRANVEGLLDREAWEAGLEREAEHRRCLTAVAERWDDVVGGLD